MNCDCFPFWPRVHAARRAPHKLLGNIMNVFYCCGNYQYDRWNVEVRLHDIRCTSARLTTAALCCLPLQYLLVRARESVCVLTVGGLFEFLIFSKNRLPFDDDDGRQRRRRRMRIKYSFAWRLCGADGVCMCVNTPFKLCFLLCDASWAK